MWASPIDFEVQDGKVCRSLRCCFALFFRKVGYAYILCWASSIFRHTYAVQLLNGLPSNYQNVP